MRFKFTEYVPSLLITLLVLVVLDIFTSSIIPSFGAHNFKLSFNILIILYLGFRLDTPFLPLFVLFLQLFHSAFSIEGWAHGTFAGVFICLIIGYVKELLSFSSALSTIVVSFLFQALWFILVSILIYFKTQNMAFITERFWLFIPECILLALFSPVFFKFLNRIWKPEVESDVGVSA